MPSGRTLVLATAALAGLLAWASARAMQRELARPLSVRSADYVGSGSCRRCHQGQYESWHRTFHRTMTQEASGDSVLGAFDGTVLDYRGTRARMSRDADGRFRIDFEGPQGNRWQAQVERVVGSHRYQQYLARRGEVYYRLPVAWHVAERRFFHMNAAFLTPDPGDDGPVRRADYDRHVTRWNDNCIFCHNVGPNPGKEGERFETEVAELGIACEACHGPASEHVALNQNPARRYSLHLSDRADPSVANPRRLPHERASQVCGRCHGQRIAADIAGVLGHGDRFVPGDDLAEHSRPLFRDSTLNGEPGVFAARFWEDGTPRLTAYEYQGLLMSPCAQRGTLQCESCHAMHEGDPAGQLRPDAQGDAACTGCHGELADPGALAEHSGHAATSSGARCRGCHMPPLVYGLVGARISHRIESPDPTAQAADGRPDACTLCHVDRSRAWAAAGTAVDADTAGEPPEVPRMLLAGDPIERAVAAAALGRAEAPAPLAPRRGLLLDAMEHDRYPAVRAIAWRSLRALWPATTPAPLPDAFDPAAGLAQRVQALGAVREALSGAHVVPPEPGMVARLRPRAEQAAIFIGE